MSAPAIIENGTEQHPLALEIAILKTSLTRCQNEASDAALRHQRQSWEASKVKGRVSLLERENTVLHAELQTMRKVPHPDSSAETHPAALHAQQMSLLLREVNTKLTLTEDRLLQCSTELIHSSGETTKAKSLAEGAYELASRARAREEEAWQRVKQLELKLRAAEEETKLSNLVVSEYADLVRSLERRAVTSRVSLTHNRSGSSAQIGEDTSRDGSTTSLVDSYTEGKQGLRRLFAEFSSDSERLHSELQEVQRELQTVHMEQQVERKQAEVDRAALAKAWMEVEKIRSGDNSAAQMVSRYMKFSQSSINKLQDALSALKTRHEATTNTLTAQLAELTDEMQSWQATAEKLSATVDELAVDLMKETFNRRREVALRIRISSREERLHERLQRWSNRGEDILHKEEGNHRLAAFADLIQDAKALLGDLNGPSQVEGDDNSPSSLSRVLAAEIAVETLAQELQMETMRRLELEKVVANEYPTGVSSAISDVILGNISTIPNNHTAQTIQPPIPVSPHDTQVAATSPPARVSTSLTNGLDEQNQAEHSTPVHQSPAFEVPLIIVDNPISEVIDSNVQTYNPLPPKPQVLSIAVAPLLHDVPEQESSNSGTRKPDAGVDVPTGSSVDVEDTPHIGNGSSTHEGKPPPESDGILHVESPQSQNGQELRPLPAAGVLPELSPIQLTSGLLDTNDDPKQEEPRDLPTDSPDAGVAGGVSTTERNISPPATSGTDFPSPGLLLTRDPADDNLDQDPDQRSSSEGTNINSTPPSSSEKSDHNTSHPHPLLEQLSRVERRYDGLLKSFRDCHIALEELKTDLSSISANQTTQISRYLPPELARAALERLHDFTEDARVELEIRKADESLLIEGYKTLLSLPGALSSMKGGLPSMLLAPGGRNASLTDKVPQPEVESDIEAFVSGDDPNVEKVQQALSKKLGDVEDDIAVLKRLLHDPDFSLESSASADEPTSSSWSSWIRASPSFQQKLLPPSFGDIMTTPRLRHSPSLPGSRHPSTAGGGDRNGPFTALGLKVPMPSYVAPAPPVHSSATYDNQPAPRARTVSTMYMLGIGSRTMNGPLGLGAASPRARIRTPIGGPLRPPSPRPQAEVDAEEDIE